jgi:hypothetical protein
MTMLAVKEIGERLARAGRLEPRPLCVYGVDEPPKDAVPLTELSRCAARAIFHMAVTKDHPAIFIGEGFEKKCCPGGLTYFGLAQRNPMLRYFLSHGNKDFRGGAAEFLRITPELAERSFEATGKICRLGRFLVISPSELIGEDPGVRSFLLFGVSESIRNLCALVHFRSEDVFGSVVAPAGASCASFITYAAGMAERSPKGAAFVGPLDPTGNSWFPKDHLSLALPIHMARTMASDVGQSFISKREGIAYPARRVAP